MSSRTYEEAICVYCSKPAAWIVYDGETTAGAEYMLTCEEDRTKAFS